MAKEPKKKSGRPKGEKIYTTIKFEKRLAGMAKAVATAKSTTVADLIGDMVEIELRKAYGKVVAGELPPD